MAKKKPESVPTAAPVFQPYLATVALPGRGNQKGRVIAERTETEYPLLFLFTDDLERRHWIKKEWIQE